MTSFHAPLTSPSHARAAHGRLDQHRFLQLFETEKTDSHKNSSNSDDILASIDLSLYSNVTPGDVQQGLQWTFILHPARSSDENNGSSGVSYTKQSKLQSNLAKLRRKSSIGGARAAERIMQMTPAADDAPMSPAMSTASSSSSTTTQASAWLKAKLRSKSIGGGIGSIPAITTLASSEALPLNASSKLKQHAFPSSPPLLPMTPSTIHTTGQADTPPPSKRPSTAASELSSSTSSNSSIFQSAPTLILSTISKDLQTKWMHAISSAISACAQEVSGVPHSSSLPSLALITPTISPASQPIDLSGYAFPRRPPPSPLRMSASTNHAPRASSFNEPRRSSSQSFLDVGVSSRSPTPSSRPISPTHTGEEQSTTPQTAKPDLPLYPVSSKRNSGSSNPLLPQWLSDVRRNSSGSLGVDDCYGWSRTPSPGKNLTPAHRNLAVSARPSVRQSKSSSFLNMDPSSSAHHHDSRSGSPASQATQSVSASPFPGPGRGIKISIHADDGSDSDLGYNNGLPRSNHFQSSQPSSRRSSPLSTPVMETSPQMHATSSRPSSRSGSPHHLCINFHQASSSSENYFRASTNTSGGNNSQLLRPVTSYASMSSVAGSSLYGGGESGPSIAQSMDPPTPVPAFAEMLGTPQSCELTPTYTSGGNSRAKLSGYFGVPHEMLDSRSRRPHSAGAAEEAVLASPCPPKSKKEREQEKKAATRSETNKTDETSFFFKSSISSTVQRVISRSTSKLAEERDRDSIKSSAESVSASSGTSITASSTNMSKQSMPSPDSSTAGTAPTSRKSSYDTSRCPSQPAPSTRSSDIGRHIIDPAELRKLMQEKLDASTSNLKNQTPIIRRPPPAGFMRASPSLPGSLESHARDSPVTSPTSEGTSSANSYLSASTSTSPETHIHDYAKYTFGKAHPAQAPLPGSISPVKDRHSNDSSKYTESPARGQFRVPRSDTASSVQVQALFAALPPPKRRNPASSPANNARPSSSSAASSMPVVLEGGPSY